MDPTLKHRWLMALTSGRYQRGAEVMRRNDLWCPLGVLCDIVAPEDWEMKNVDYSHRNSVCFPDESVIRLLSYNYQQANDFAEEVALLNDNNCTYEKVIYFIFKNI